MGADIPPDAPADDEPEGFEILPDNWDSALAFLACETQWRQEFLLVGTGQGFISQREWLGFDYPGVDVVLRRRLPEDRSDQVFADLQVMETAALEAFAEARA